MSELFRAVQAISQKSGLDIKWPIADPVYAHHGFAPFKENTSLVAACIHALALDPLLFLLSQELKMLLDVQGPVRAVDPDIPAASVETGVQVAHAMQLSAHPGTQAPQSIAHIDVAHVDGPVGTYHFLRDCLLAACAVLDPASSILREICSSDDDLYTVGTSAGVRLSTDTVVELDMLARKKTSCAPRVIMLHTENVLVGSTNDVQIQESMYDSSHVIVCDSKAAVVVHDKRDLNSGEGSSFKFTPEHHYVFLMRR